MSKILRLFEQPWAITEQALDALVDIALRLKSPEDFQFGAQTSGFTDSDAPYAIENGIAIIPIEGTLYKRSYFFSCGSTYNGIRQRLEHAVSNYEVKAILLDGDSPGGGVGGGSDLAECIYSIREKKPIYAFTDSQMTSAAYWLGSAAQMVAASSVAQIGSIGVITMHTDYSKADEQAGIKRTYITAGKYKAIGNDAEPLSKEGLDYIKDRLNATYSIFIDAVAKHRGVSVEDALKMADGKVFLAEEARKIGLIDVVTTKEEFLTKITEVMSMNLQELQAKYPQLVEQIKADTMKDVEAKTEEAVKAERERILGLFEVVDSGVTEKVKAMIEAGVTPEQAKAMATVFAQEQKSEEAEAKDKKSEILAALKEAHGEGVAGNVPDASAGQGNILLKVIQKRNKTE